MIRWPFLALRAWHQAAAEWVFCIRRECRQARLCARWCDHLSLARCFKLYAEPLEGRHPTLAHFTELSCSL